MFEKAWCFGDGSKPPKWLMKEFQEALRLMSRNRECVHMFDTGTGPDGRAAATFVIAFSRTFSSDEMARRISIALDADRTAGEIAAKVIDSRERAGEKT